MEQRQCGFSNLKLPILGIGCWSFGGGSYWGDQDQRDVDAVVSRALALECNFFDTAEFYNDGRSEASLGIALQGRRQQAIIATKINPSSAYPNILREHCEASLKRLKTDYIDLYMLHWWPSPQALRHTTTDESIIKNPPSLEDAIETMVNLQKEGKCRYIGVSNFGVKQLTELLKLNANIIFNELPYSLLMRAIEIDILPLCQKHSVGVLGFKPLMQGLLTGKYSSIDEVPASRTRTRHFAGSRPGSRHGGPGAEAETFAALERVRKIAAEQGLSMSTLAIAWSIANPVICSMITGARDCSQLEANAASVKVKLAPSVIDALNNATRPLLNTLGSNVDYFESAENSRIF